MRRLLCARGCCSSFGNCTSLRPQGGAPQVGRVRLQFLRELHFIEAIGVLNAKSCPHSSCSSFGNCTSLRPPFSSMTASARGRCSSFGNCTSLRRVGAGGGGLDLEGCSSFGNCTSLRRRADHHRQLIGGLQFLRELHFIEARQCWRSPGSRPCCSSFGNCTSLRLQWGML